MKKTIVVTEAHIREGKPRNYQFCSIALALLGAGFDVEGVMPDGIAIVHSNNEKGYYCIALPKLVRDFIFTIDTKGRKFVKPFSFQVEV